MTDKSLEETLVKVKYLSGSTVLSVTVKVSLTATSLPEASIWIG